MNGNRKLKVRDDSISESARFTLTTDVRDWQLGRDLLVYTDRNRDGIGYIARSTNSIDCKPYYDCFKGQGPSGCGAKKVSFDKIELERHSDTYADYRECDNELKELYTVDDAKNGFKFKFNRSLNSCQIKNKRKVNTVFWTKCFIVSLIRNCKYRKLYFIIVLNISRCKCFKPNQLRYWWNQ